MATAETVLAVYSDRGKRGLPLNGVYRQLYRRELYLRAYGRIHRNDGAMTPGVTDETVDAMSLEKIDRIIDAMRRETYRWSPARRTHILKKNGKKRPLGLPTCNWLRVLFGVDGGVLNVRHAIRGWCTARRRMGDFVPCWTLFGLERTSRSAARLRQD
jgi:hypothetical protein